MQRLRRTLPLPARTRLAGPEARKRPSLQEALGGGKRRGRGGVLDRPPAKPGGVAGSEDADTNAACVCEAVGAVRAAPGPQRAPFRGSAALARANPEGAARRNGALYVGASVAVTARLPVKAWAGAHLVRSPRPTPLWLVVISHKASGRFVLKEPNGRPIIIAILRSPGR